MKLTSSILGCVAGVYVSACAFSAAHAQDGPEKTRVTWGLMAAGDAITGAYRGTIVSGVAGGVLAQFPLPSRRLSVRADLVYHWVGTNGGDKVNIVRVGGSGGDGRCTGGFLCAIEGSWSRVIATSVSLVARLNDPVTRWSPYVLGGFAAYLTGNSDEPLHQFHPNHLGFQGGVGFEVRPNRHAYFLEMRYLGVPPGGVVPVTIGMRF